jgi:hypothetical protein
VSAFGLIVRPRVAGRLWHGLSRTQIFSQEGQKAENLGFALPPAVCKLVLCFWALEEYFSIRSSELKNAFLPSLRPSVLLIFL